MTLSLPKSSARFLAGAALAGLCSAAIAGCGNDIPSNAVAKVGDSVISKEEFDRWLTNAAAGQAQGGQATTPDPPDYEKCVASLSKQPVPEGGDKPSKADLRKQCEDQYDQLKQEVMQFLIQAEWVQQEAEEQDVEVTDEEVEKSFADQKKQAFPKEADYKKFLDESGMSEEDILFRVKLDTLQTKLTQKITKERVEISDDDIASYYEKNKQRFAQPERRDLNAVLTKTEDRAEEAKEELEDGTKFAAVAKEFSIDPASKAQGGKLPDVSKGQYDKAFDEAVFAAKKGELEGPVKTQFGYYVFEVAKVEEPSQQTLEEAKETIRNLLRSQREQKTLESYIKEFRESYKDKTECSDDYAVAECSNAPKDETNTNAAPGGQPAPGGAGAPAAPAPTAPPSAPAPPGAPAPAAP